MRCIIVDTSSILFGFYHHIDIFDKILDEMLGYKIIISKGVIRELEKLANSRKQKPYAEVALSSVQRHKIEILENDSNVDSWIMEESAKNGCVVCTNDMDLKRRLKSKGVSVVSLSLSGRLK